MSDNSNKPTHRVFAVRSNEDKSRWTEIGALWPHKDGKGFSLKLDLIPIDGSDLSIRLNEPKQDDSPLNENGGSQ